MLLINITYNISDVKRELKKILLPHKAIGYSIRHIGTIKILVILNKDFY